MLNNASIQLIRSSSKMASTLATRSLCARSMGSAVIGCQRSSLFTQIDLSRLSFQSPVRNYSTTLPRARDFDYRTSRPKFGKRRRNSNDRDSISRDNFVEVEEVDESHLDRPFEAGSKESNPITNEYTSLKPYITSNTFRALTADPFNFKEMSEVQQRVLSLLPELANPFNDSPMPDNQGGRDLLVKAKTGTGKTIAFLTPAIERRLRASRQVLEGKFTGPFKKMLAQERPDILEFTDLDQNTLTSLRRTFNASTAGVLVLSPTRELATQIAVEAEKLTKHNRNLNVQLLVGGASRINQLRQWSRSRPDIVVATPGRLMDLLNEEKMVSKALSAVQTLIYDEADTLLDMGFRDDIEKILRFLPKKEDRCTMLFSATVSSDIREIARKSLASDHRFIDCVPAGESNVHEHIPQFATLVRDGKEQLEQMTRLIAIDQLTNAGNSKIVVFAPTTKMVALYTSLFQDRQGLLDGLPAGKNTSVYELHSKKDSSQRFRISSSFRNDKSGASILFTSDVSARGVDYPGTTRVINLGISGTTDQYIHRIGRTGRAGAQGRADIILQRFEAGFLDASLRKLPIKVEKVEDTKAQLAKLCQDFDENPDSVVSMEVMDRMNAFSDRTSNNSRTGNSRNSSEKRITPAAKFFAPLGERLSDESIKAKVEMTKSRTAPAEVEDVFMSNLGFYISKAKEMGTNPDAVIDGLKEWAMSISDLPREPYVSPAMLSKMGVGGGSRKHSNRSGNSSRFGGPSSGRGRFDGGQSYGRGRFDGGNERRNDFDGYSRGGRSFNDRRSAERFF